MAKNGKRAAKEDNSNKCSKRKVHRTKKKITKKMGTENVRKISDLLNHSKGYVNQEEEEAFRMLFLGQSKAPLDNGHINSILRVADRVICMNTETFNEDRRLLIVFRILARLSPYCDIEDRSKQVETFVSTVKTKFSEEEIEKAILQVKCALRPAVVALMKSNVQQPPTVGPMQDAHAASKTVGFKLKDEEPILSTFNKPTPGLYVTLVLHLRHFVSFRMRQILQVFQKSEAEAVKQLIALRFPAFKVQADYDEIHALGEVIRLLLGVDPRRENLHLTFDCLVWMQKLSNKSEKRRELTRAVASDFRKRRGTLWVIKWIAENAQAVDQPVGVELVVNSLEAIDLSSECITEMMNKDNFVPALQESIAKRFSDFDNGAKEDLVNQIVNYLLKENLSRETNMNRLIADLLVNLLWMTYYDQRSLFNLLCETLTAHAADLNQYTCYKTVTFLYSWFKTGTISPFLVEYIKGKTFWFRERSSLLFFEFCLAVTEPHFHDSICNEFKRYIHVYFFNPGGALFVQYVLSPPPIAFNDTLKRRTQEERLTTIDSMRKALIPCLCALIKEKPAGVFLWSEVRCSLTSKLIMNLNDPKILRSVVKKITDGIVTFMARSTFDKNYPWILKLVLENIAMDTFLYSVQMFEEETEYFSDLFLDFFPTQAFVQHTRSPVWRSLVLMLINTGIPRVLLKVNNRLKDLKPPTTMKSSEEIEFWQTVSDLY